MNIMETELNKIEAVFLLPAEKYPKRKRTTIIITEEDDKVAIGVTVRARVYGGAENGAISVHEEQHGDYRIVSKDYTMGEFFNIVKELFEELPEIIDNTGVKA